MLVCLSGRGDKDLDTVLAALGAARLMGALEARAPGASRRAAARAFVPYLTGGFPGVDAALLRAVADAGADAIEVGVPHSDPVMDGGVIQAGVVGRARGRRHARRRARHDRARPRSTCRSP